MPEQSSFLFQSWGFYRENERARKDEKQTGVWKSLKGFQRGKSWFFHFLIFPSSLFLSCFIIKSNANRKICWLLKLLARISILNKHTCAKHQNFGVYLRKEDDERRQTESNLKRSRFKTPSSFPSGSDTPKLQTICHCQMLTINRRPSQSVIILGCVLLLHQIHICFPPLRREHGSGSQ